MSCKDSHAAKVGAAIITARWKTKCGRQVESPAISQNIIFSMREETDKREVERQRRGEETDEREAEAFNWSFGPIQPRQDGAVFISACEDFGLSTPGALRRSLSRLNFPDQIRLDMDIHPSWL